MTTWVFEEVGVPCGAGVASVDFCPGTNKIFQLATFQDCSHYAVKTWKLAFLLHWSI